MKRRGLNQIGFQQSYSSSSKIAALHRVAKCENLFNILYFFHGILNTYRFDFDFEIEICFCMSGRVFVEVNLGSDHVYKWNAPESEL